MVVGQEDLNGQTKLVGLVLLLNSKVISMFLTLPNTSVQAELIIGRINQRGGYWLDIPVLDHFYGYRKGADWLKNRLETIGKNLEKDMRHCLKYFNEAN